MSDRLLHKLRLQVMKEFIEPCRLDDGPCDDAEFAAMKLSDEVVLPLFLDNAVEFEIESVRNVEKKTILYLYRTYSFTISSVSDAITS